jgi:hypothetical protein
METSFIFISQETCSVSSSLPRISLCGNMFASAFPSTGCTCHNPVSDSRRVSRLFTATVILQYGNWMPYLFVDHWMCIWKNYRSRDSVVGIATGYGLDDQGVGVRVPEGSIILIFARRPDRLWGLPNGYRGLFTRGKAVGAWSWPFTSS